MSALKNYLSNMHSVVLHHKVKTGFQFILLLGADCTSKTFAFNIFWTGQRSAFSLNCIHEGTIFVSVTRLICFWHMIQALEHFIVGVTIIVSHQIAVILHMPGRRTHVLGRNHQHVAPFSALAYCTGDVMILGCFTRDEI